MYVAMWKSLDLDDQLFIITINIDLVQKKLRNKFNYVPFFCAEGTNGKREIFCVGRGS